MNTNHNIGKMLGYSVAGGAVGLICGLTFAYVIVLIGSFLLHVKIGGLSEILPILGMIGGSVIGSVFGAIGGLKR